VYLDPFRYTCLLLHRYTRLVVHTRTWASLFVRSRGEVFFLDGPQGGLLGFDWGGLVALIDFPKRCCIYFPYWMSEVWVTRHVQLFSLTQGISPMCQVLDIEVGPFCA
jgi:hypothetical protein